MEAQNRRYCVAVAALGVVLPLLVRSPSPAEEALLCGGRGMRGVLMLLLDLLLLLTGSAGFSPPSPPLCLDGQQLGNESWRRRRTCEVGLVEPA